MRAGTLSWWPVLLTAAFLAIGFSGRSIIANAMIGAVVVASAVWRWRRRRRNLPQDDAE
jgi:uncharacterized membrane protein AbrB (regulator of aidB expression)